MIDSRDYLVSDNLNQKIKPAISTNQQLFRNTIIGWVKDILANLFPDAKSITDKDAAVSGKSWWYLVLYGCFRKGGNSLSKYTISEVRMKRKGMITVEAALIMPVILGCIFMLYS